jgi:hypothetical protein
MTGYDAQATWKFADNEHTVVLTSEEVDAKFSGGHIGNEYQVKNHFINLKILTQSSFVYNVNFTFNLVPLVPLPLG